ncbi:Hypothetical protein A7982_03851 [Minicystis rosea]|nr:Hypothetical protein A7982_03851 [Minicystis rosea]
MTILLRGHVPVHVVRELVGHEDLATTQGYAAIGSTECSDAVGVLERVYRGEPTELAGVQKRVRRMQRVSRITGRIRLLRKRVLARLKSRGNNSETPPIAA